MQLTPYYVYAALHCNTNNEREREGDRFTWLAPFHACLSAALGNTAVRISIRPV